MFIYLQVVYDRRKGGKGGDSSSGDVDCTLVDNIQMIVQELLLYKLEYRSSQLLQQLILSTEDYFHTIY